MFGSETNVPNPDLFWILPDPDPQNFFSSMKAVV